MRIGSAWSAISAPTICGQWVTIPIEAKPWRANRSAMVLLTSWLNGLGLERAGLFTATGSVNRCAMSLAVNAPAQKVDRVIARLYAVEEELPGAKPRIRSLAERLTPARRAGDFAQSLMDLGATICTPKNPACALCPWNDVCAAHARGDQETFPRKAAKKAGALRKG